jgi:hypothetical protein
MRKGHTVTMQRYEQDSRITLGQTHLDATDFVPPRVKVVQAMSKENTDQLAKIGDFYNTLTGESYGPTLRFIPIVPFKQRVFLVRDERREAYDDALTAVGLAPLSEGQGLKCRSLDTFQGIGEPGILCNDCPLRAWGPANRPPYCTETYNVAAINELGELLFLGFQKSSAKVGKRLFSALRLRREAPWVFTYEAKTSMTTNARGTFAVPAVMLAQEEGHPLRTNDELIKVAIEWGNQLAGVTIDVTPTEDEDEEPAEPETAPF